MEDVIFFGREVNLVLEKSSLGCLLGMCIELFNKWWEEWGWSCREILDLEILIWEWLKIVLRVYLVRWGYLEIENRRKIIKNRKAVCKSCFVKEVLYYGILWKKYSCI